MFSRILVETIILSFEEKKHLSPTTSNIDDHVSTGRPSWEQSTTNSRWILTVSKIACSFCKFPSKWVGLFKKLKRLSEKFRMMMIPGDSPVDHQWINQKTLGKPTDCYQLLPAVLTRTSWWKKRNVKNPVGGFDFLFDFFGWFLP